jgi:tellurite resistance protein TehA-like permease
MATGIVSVALHLTGYEVLSLIVLALGCVAWLALAADFAVGLLHDRQRWLGQAKTPAALTAVAATTVLGTRFALLGRHTLAAALLALAAVLWPALLFLVVRNRQRRMPGAVFLICVATQGLAVLGATLAAAEATPWLAHTALVLFWLGLVLYLLALARFDVRQVLTGAGDQWVAAGALAISALAGARLMSANSPPAPYPFSPALYLWNKDDQDVLHTATIALLVLDLACYAVLLIAEVMRPRLRYDVRRWSTVFPLGMTAAASLSVSAAAAIPWLRGLGQVLLWIAVAAWLLVGVGAVAAARSGIGGTGPGRTRHLS